MNWSRMKTAAIIMLALTCAGIFIAMTAYERMTNYIPASAIENAVDIMAGVGVIIPDGVIPDKKPAAQVYECDIGDDYYGSLASALTGAAVLRGYATPDGYIVTTEDGGRFEFSNTLGMVYTSGLMPDLDVPAPDAFDALSGETVASAKVQKLALRFIKAGIGLFDGGKSYTHRYEVRVTECKMKDGVYYARCVQYLDGLRIVGEGFVCAVADDMIAGVNGDVCFALPTETVDSQLYDQLNILLTEKENFAKNSAEGLIMREFSFCRCVYMSADINKIIIVPCWYIGYNDGGERIYNAADMSLYTTRS